MATMKTVTGRQRATKAIREQGHAAGFEAALDKALAKLSTNGWNAGSYKNVQVDFGADITVTNPGSIDTYLVMLKHG